MTEAAERDARRERRGNMAEGANAPPEEPGGGPPEPRADPRVD